MLQTIYHNNSLEDWLISVAILVVALLINLFISFINRRYLRSLAQRTSNYVDNILVSTMETPMKVAIILAAVWIAFHRLQLSAEFQDWLYKTYKILTVLNVTWFIVHMINGVLKEYFIKTNERNIKNNRDVHYNKHLITIILKLISFTVWTIGMVTALNNAGLELKAILGTLGIGGIAIALASQDTVKNVFGGFTVLLDSTFRIGDRVQIGTFEGEVEDIGIRSTKIRDKNRQLIIIPNFKIVEGAIINISAATRSNVSGKIQLAGSNTYEQLELAVDTIKNILKEHNQISKTGIEVYLSEIGQAAYSIEFAYYVSRPARKSPTVSEINFEILKQFVAAKIELK